MRSKLVISSSYSRRPTSRSTLVSRTWRATAAAEEAVARGAAVVVVAVAAEVEAGLAVTMRRSVETVGSRRPDTNR